PISEEVEAIGHDADDGGLSAIERDDFADDRRLTEEAALPHPMADDDDRRHLIDGVFVVGERAADDRLDAERAKHTRRYRLPEYPLGRDAVLFEAERLHSARDAVVCGD